MGTGIGVRAIDAVCNFEFTDHGVSRPAWSREFLTAKVKADGSRLDRFTVEDMLAKMDRVGVERAFLIAVKAGSESHRINHRVSCEAVAEVVRMHPDRFSGLAGVDPTEGMSGVRELTWAIEELGFVGAHLYPHWYELSPDHARFYPFYAKCAELDVPIQIQVGHCLRYSAERPLRNVGHPMALDAIACDLPELKLVGIHIGWPWTEEMIAVAYKHPNVYIGSDAYAPKHWPASFVRYLSSWGQDKVIFGTDFPVIDPERAMREIADLGLDENIRRKFLRDNVRNLYGLA